MAAEDIRVLEVRTGKSVQNVRELRDYINALRKALNDENASLAENRKTAEELRAAQQTLRDVMHSQTQTVEELKAKTDAMIGSQGELIKNTDGLTVSYNDLVHQLDDLKRAWRSTGDEAERAVLTGQIDKVNSKLKQLDASVGTYSRNVGNYTNQVSAWTEKMTKGFAATAGGARSVINPLANVTAGLKAMSATPAVATLGLLANGLSVVVRGMKDSEENTNKLTRAMAAFAPIGDAVRRTVQEIGGAIADLSGKIVGLLDKWGLLGQAARDRMALAEQQQQLSNRERENIVAEANLERDLAQQRAIAADKEGRTTRQRLEALNEVWRDEKAIHTARKAQLEERLRLETAEADRLKDTSDATQTRLAQLKADIIKEDAAIQEARRRNLKETQAIEKEAAASARRAANDARQAAKDRQQAAAAELAAERDLVLAEAELLAVGSEDRLAKMKEAREIEYRIAVDAARARVKNEEALQRTLTALEAKYNHDIEQLEAEHTRELAAEEVRVLENRMNAQEAGSAEYLAAAVELRRKEQDVLRRLDGETDAQFEARLIAARKAVEQAERDLEKAATDAGRQVLQNAADTLATGSMEQLYALIEVAKYDLDNLTREVGESAEAFEGRRIAAANAYADAVQEAADRADEQERLGWENRMNTYREGSLDYLAAAVDLKRYELDTLHRLEGESNEEFRARQLQAESEYSNALQALWQGRVNMVLTYTDAISGLISGLADVYEQDAENSEKSAKMAKALRIASATIDTLSGAVSAYASAQALGPPAGPIIGAINAAAVIAMGVAQIAKIRATQVDRNGSGSDSLGATARVAPAVPQTVQQSAMVEAAYNTRQINARQEDSEPQEVYILQSCMEASGRQVQVRETESTF